MNVPLCEHRMPSGARIALIQGDITEERVDAIVNAANSRLQHGGGVAGQISRKGGPTIQRESDALGYVETGRAAVTGAGMLPCRYVIHAVGPIWGEGSENELLENAAQSSLEHAEELKLESISLPAISSGIFGFPKDRCAEILLRTAAGYLEENPRTSLREIRFCLFDSPTVAAFVDAWGQRFGARESGEQDG